MIPEKPRPVLVGLAAHKAVKVFEAHSARPLIERSRQTLIGAWRVVILAEPGSRVSILLEDFADGRVLPPNDGVISWIAGGLLSKHTESRAVMVAAGEQCRPRGRAERGGVELRISKPRLCNPVERRRWDDTAEGARNAVALVVGHDQQDVWSPLGRHDARRPIRRGIFGIEADIAAESRRGRRQVIAVNARGGVWRSRGACGVRCARHNWLLSMDGSAGAPFLGLASRRGGARARVMSLRPATHEVR